MSEIDFHILELLSSKICHDLISPIGAVNNGMEFVEEMGADAGEEVFELIGFSASQASAKLTAYRMAYGSGGSDSSIKPESVHETIESIVGAEKKIIQDWDPYGDLGFDERPDAYSKLLISAILLAMEALPKGGTIKVSAGEGMQTLIRAEGDDAGLRDGIEDALSLSISKDSLQPKHMHAYLCGLNAQNYGYNLSNCESGDGYTVFTLQLPAE